MVEEKQFSLPHGRGQIAAKHWFKDQSGPSILAVHGWLDNAATFDRCFPELTGHPIFAIDLAGHGKSSHRAAGMRYHNAEFLDDLLAVMDEISPSEPIILLGHSLGAGLLMLMAALFPQRVSKLVLIEGLGPIASDPTDIVSLTRDALLRYQQLSMSVRPIESIEVATKARMQGMTGALSREAAELLLQRGINQCDDGSYVWSTDKRLRLPSLMRYSEQQVVSFIQAIAAPTLLIMGDTGMLAMAASSPQYAARINHFKDLQQVSLSGGHHLHLDESPRQVALAINAFLGSKA